MKGVETGVCQNNDGGTRTHVDKKNVLFNMINFLLEKVIRCAQMSVDCLRASKLVTLGYAC